MTSLHMFTGDGGSATIRVEEDWQAVKAALFNASQGRGWPQFTHAIVADYSDEIASRELMLVNPAYVMSVT
jgi:hypothetical protein